MRQRALRAFARDRGELLGLEFLRQRGDELVEVAVHDGVDFIQCKVDTVVGDAALREVVRADALAAVALADQALALRRLAFLALAALAVEQP